MRRLLIFNCADNIGSYGQYVNVKDAGTTLRRRESITRNDALLAQLHMVDESIPRMHVFCDLHQPSAIIKVPAHDQQRRGPSGAAKICRIFRVQGHTLQVLLYPLDNHAVLALDHGVDSGLAIAQARLNASEFRA